MFQTIPKRRSRHICLIICYWLCQKKKQRRQYNKKSKSPISRPKNTKALKWWKDALTWHHFSCNPKRHINPFLKPKKKAKRIFQRRNLEKKKSSEKETVKKKMRAEGTLPAKGSRNKWDKILPWIENRENIPKRKTGENTPKPNCSSYLTRLT